MSEYVSIKSRVLNLLRKVPKNQKTGFTANYLATKLGDVEKKTIYDTISHLRREGYRVQTMPNRTGEQTYRI